MSCDAILSAEVWPRASARGVPAEAGTYTEPSHIQNVLLYVKMNGRGWQSR